MATITVTSSTTKSGYSSPQFRSPSFASILKTLLVFGGCFQTGITPASAEIAVAKLPEYCTTRYELHKFGYPFYVGMQANTECFLDSVKFFQNQLQNSAGIDRLLAEFTLGRRLACLSSPIGATVMTDSEQIELTKKSRQQNLEGIAHMHNSGCLEIIYPKEGQTVKECYKEYISTRDPGSINYCIDDCYYFITGTLICPNKDSYENLIIQGSRAIFTKYQLSHCTQR